MSKIIIHTTHTHLHHHDADPNVAAALDELLTLGQALKAQGALIMATVQDVQDQAAKTLAAVTAEKTVVDSVMTLVQAYGTTLADIRAQLAAAIAAGADPGVLQGIVDQLATAEASATADAQTMAAAVTAGVPAA